MVTSRELRWLSEEGHVEMRGLGLRAEVWEQEEREVEEEVEAVAKSLFKAPQLPCLELSTKPSLEFKPGVRLRLRCRLMFKSSLVAEGRLPKLMEFLLAFFPILLRLTLAEFPIRDLQGVTLPPGSVEGVLRLSKAERDWVDPWPLPWVRRPLWVRSEVEEATRLRYWRARREMYCSNWVKEAGAGDCGGRRPRLEAVVAAGGSSAWGPSGLGEGDGSWLWEVNRGLWRATACSGLG